MTFPTRLRAARLSRGLTQKQVGDACGLTKKMVGDYEQGRCVPRPDSIAALCRGLRISADWLLGVEVPPPASARQQADYRERILSAVCLAFDVRKEDVLGPRRFTMPTAARHAAMWLMIQQMGMSYAAIGEYFDGRDHSTVCHARQNVENWQAFDGPMYARVQIALSILGAARAPALPRQATAPGNPGHKANGGDRVSTGLLGASNEATLFNGQTHEVA